MLYEVMSTPHILANSYHGTAFQMSDLIFPLAFFVQSFLVSFVFASCLFSERCFCFLFCLCVWHVMPHPPAGPGISLPFFSRRMHLWEVRMSSILRRDSLTATRRAVRSVFFLLMSSWIAARVVCKRQPLCTAQPCPTSPQAWH